MALGVACAVEGCGCDTQGLKMYCRRHQRRYRLYGSPSGGGTDRGALMAWIDAHVGHKGDECLPWPFSFSSAGYGQVHWRRGNIGAHRLMCQLAHGAPTGPALEAAHSCGNRSCVNPNHLRWASRSENENDKRMHDRVARGSRHGRSKLSEADVIRIKARIHQVTMHSLATEYGVSMNAIASIKSGTSWHWL